RLTALEEAVRAAPRGVAVTAAVVTGEPAELGPLARLVLADADRHLGAAFPPGARPTVRIVLDEAGALAVAAGVTAVSDATEAAAACGLAYLRRSRPRHRPAWRQLKPPTSPTESARNLAERLRTAQTRRP